MQRKHPIGLILSVSIDARVNFFGRYSTTSAIVCAFFATTVFLTAAVRPLAGEGTFYVDYRATVPANRAGAFPLAILHPNARTDFAALRRSGSVALAYISVGEIAADASYRELAKKLPLLGRNEAWNSDIIDLRDARWRDLLLDKVAAPAVARGFDGFFLDTPDTLLAAAGPDTPKGRELRAALVGFVRELRRRHPGKRIVLNRGFELFKDLPGVADGVMAESVFAGFNPETGKCAPVPPEETKELLGTLRALRREGFAVYVLDYADRNDEAGAFAAAGKIRAEGFSALVSTPELMGATLAPWREAPRRVVTLYNTDANTEWPEDSVVSATLQLPLEWLGYETDFIRVGDAFEPPAATADTYAAIVIPADFIAPAGHEKAFVDWLIAAKDAGVKLILLTGGDMVDDETQRARLLDALGVKGSGGFSPTARKFHITRAAPGMTDFETGPPDTARQLPDIVAPAGAQVAVECEVEAAPGERARITPVFTAPWGGMALSPFVSWTRPDYAKFWRIDPFAFLTGCLGGRKIPATDVTTAGGLRVFISHIDGDGFANRSSTRQDTFTGEIIRDSILKKYPLPVTVSVIEAEVRCLAENLDEKDRPRLEDTAREIFRLPNVEVASHSYTHPFYWIRDDKTSGTYSNENLRLKTPYTLDLNREIAGSIAYINTTLAPKDKPVSLFLWTGNCRPGPEALRLVREAGIESLNGGDTIISPLTRTITAAAARSVPWGDELQVRAPMQNENVYTHLFTGKVRGSFIRLLQTFKMTEDPRRLKAANLYYHFYSGDRTDSLKAIEAVCDWAMATPLHPMKASDYAKSVRDAAGTEIFRDAAGRFLISGSGACTTVRLPAAAGTPDLAASVGVIGHADKSDERYIQLADTPVRLLALAAKPARHAHFVTTEAGLKDLVLEKDRVAFTALAWRPAPTVIGGLPPETAGRLTLSGKTAAVRSDAAGRCSFTAAPGDRVELDFRE